MEGINMLDHSQILAASLASYSIAKEGVENSAGSEYIGFLPGSIRIFETGFMKKEACYIAETEDEIILAFRGTVLGAGEVPAEQAAEWINHMDSWLVAIPGFPGMVHATFHKSVYKLQRKGFENEIIRRRKQSPHKKLIITGFGKGGGLAPLAAFVLINTIRPSDKVYLFSPARCGNGAFAYSYNTAFPETIRYEFQDDLLPHLPPTVPFLNTMNLAPNIPQAVRDAFPEHADFSYWDYKSVGILKFINWDNEIVSESQELEASRTNRLIDLIQNNPEKCMNDHLPAGHLFDAITLNFPSSRIKECPEVKLLDQSALAVST